MGGDRMGPDGMIQYGYGNFITGARGLPHPILQRHMVGYNCIVQANQLNKTFRRNLATPPPPPPLLFLLFFLPRASLLPFVWVMLSSCLCWWWSWGAVRGLQ